MKQHRQRTMGVSIRGLLQGTAAVCVVLVLFYFMIFHTCPGEKMQKVFTKHKLSPSRLASQNPPLPPGSCSCPGGSDLLKDHLPKEQYEELEKRRAKEFKQHKDRTTSVLSRLLFASPNSPLQYPIQGFTVQPLTSTAIPGLALHAGERSNYKVSLNVSRGILTTTSTAEGATVKSAGETGIILESSSLTILNYLLSKVSYTSTIYHVHTGDLVTFQFEEHEAVFPITIKQPQMPVLYDMGTGISSQVTITTKTFLRYTQLNVLLDSIRKFYKDVEIIIADDSFKPEVITGEHIRQYFMPAAQGWFAGRNLAVSQVTTKYFLWVDDDFLFTEKTKMEKLVEVMEAVPELDVVGGTVTGNQFYFSLLYEEGDEKDGGCLTRKSNQKFHSLPGYPQCSLASGVVNFFLARTQSVQRVGFDPKLQRVAHSEFFMDGLGSLMVATCSHVSIGHQSKAGHHKNDDPRYAKYRHPPKGDSEFKLRLHYFKNYLKCVAYR